jgi:hypothetical protein
MGRPAHNCGLSHCWKRRSRLIVESPTENAAGTEAPGGDTLSPP